MVIPDRGKRVGLGGGVINRLDYYRGEVDREQEMKGGLLLNGQNYILYK